MFKMSNRFLLLVPFSYFMFGSSETLSRFGHNSKPLLRGPVFTSTPPAKMSFSNSTGGVLPCTARGANDETPKISWISQDGRSVQIIPGIVELSSNGSLVFPPFGPYQYDTTIHDAIFRCKVSTPSGTLLSRPVQVRGVVVGDYEIQVYDQLVMVGNTGELTCSVPPYVSEYVTITSWVHDSAFNIYPSLHGDGKYHMTPSGDLLVLSVGPQDGHSRFQCRTLHKLTGETQLSRAPARIIVTEPQGSVPPRINERMPRITSAAGNDVMLPCVAQGHPQPQYSWYHGSTPVHQSDRTWIVGGSLVLVGVGLEDAGEYRCVANNSAGTSRYTLHLSIATPLSVQVSPSETEVDSGMSLDLKCHITGHPIDSVTWYKDGTILRPTGRIGIRPREMLHIDPIEKKDSGVYQCEATSPHSFAQGHSYVTLGAATPALLYRFISQTLQPGPSVSLKCIATGTPTPHFTWTLDGFQLPQSHRFLIGQYVSGHGDVISHVNISSVRVSDGGSYKCKASNAAGAVTHQARLNIYGPPQVRPMGSISAVAGEDFSVTCPVGGHPIDRMVWKKDGVRLPSNHRQRVHTNGSLFIKKINRDGDEGIYSCSAFDRQGRSHIQTLTLSIIVPPRLAPISFTEGTRAGMRAQVTCLVQEGDQPITLTWMKDELPLKSQLDLSISNLDPFTSILVVKSATAEHTGNYTCVATNPVRKVVETATLIVRVPPRWSAEPTGRSVSLGGSVTLQCLAYGFPDPKVHWRKETVSGEFVTMNTDLSLGVRTWVNGTLKFSRAERRHEGRYLCEADNGVGGGLSKVITLQVNEPPWFALRSQRIQVQVDSLAKLTCQAKGDPPLNIIWTRDGSPLPPYPRYEVSERESDDGTNSELLVRRSQVQDSGTFVCEASNPHGTLTSDFHLVVQDVPDPPTALTVIKEGSRFLILKWIRPSDSNAPISAFIVTYQVLKTNRKGIPREVTIEGNRVQVRIENLSPATSHSFAVFAVNRVGKSPSSTSVRHATLEEEPTGHPRNIRVIPISSTALQVSWDPPKENETNGLILGYYLGYKDESVYPLVDEMNPGAYNFTTVGVEGLGVTSTTLTALRPFTKYSVVIQAFNSRGAGPSSRAIIATTKEDKPSGPPTHITCHPLTSSTHKVTWSAVVPREANGIIISYKLTYRLDPPKEEHDGSGLIVVEGMEATLTSLTPWSNYTISVAASTRIGEGNPSSEITCRTLEDVPQAPKIVKAIASGPYAAMISWSVPTEPNGHLVGFTVYWAQKKNVARVQSRYVEAPQTHLVLHELSPTSYQIWVAASTSIGKGLKSKTTDVVITSSTQVNAGIWSVGGNITVGWKDDVRLPCRTVGSPEAVVTWLHLEKTLSRNTERLAIFLDGTLRLTNTQKSDSGLYSCRANNMHGSDAVGYNVKILVPPSKPFLHVTETTSSSIRLQWSVEDDGGSQIRRSNLFLRKFETDTKEVIIHSNHFSKTVTNLDCGTKYFFFLTSTNRIGTSDASMEVEARTKGRPPVAPPLFQFVTTNSSQATLYLTQWEASGCRITHFHVEYRKSGSSGSWTIVGNDILPIRTFAVSGLSPGRKYALKVRAFNAAGYTEEEYLVSTPPVGIGFGTNHMSESSWDMSSNTGGMFTPSAWRDPRVIVPIVVSISAFVLIVSTVCICLRRRTLHSSISTKESDGGSPGRISKEGYIEGHHHNYSPIRRMLNSTPQPPPPSESRDSTGDYSEEDIYHYASGTATYQLRNASPPPPPPPPAPPSPPHHNHKVIMCSQQKGFSSHVYQPPSLHDVDGPNVNNRCVVEDYPQSEISETDDYGSIAEGDHNFKQRQTRPPRIKNHKAKHITIRDSNKLLGSRPQLAHITLRPKARLPNCLVEKSTTDVSPERPLSKPECDIHW